MTYHDFQSKLKRSIRKKDKRKMSKFVGGWKGIKRTQRKVHGFLFALRNFTDLFALSQLRLYYFNIEVFLMHKIREKERKGKRRWTQCHFKNPFSMRSAGLSWPSTTTVSIWRALVPFIVLHLTRCMWFTLSFALTYFSFFFSCPLSASSWLCLCCFFSDCLGQSEQLWQT